MTLKDKTVLLASCALFAVACASSKQSAKENKSFIKDNINFAHKQICRELEVIEKSGECLNPVTLKRDGSVYYCDYSDWRSGFFPGTLWLLYELTGDTSIVPKAEEHTLAIEKAKDVTWHHDVGFMVNCSFGNAYRITHKTAYRDAMLQAARSLSTRFRPKAGVIQSWNVSQGWQKERGWECPVIIDNMMNLELLFEATLLSGDSTYYNMAVSHADRTLKEQFREDGSCYHVIDYGLNDGAVKHRHTAQGYSHESVWSRGQAWAIYGFAMCYRYTGDRKYLNQALRTFRMMKDHPRMPSDLVPYWDMDAPNIPDEPRDASSASVIASALYEISTMPVDNPFQYKSYADSIMRSLSSSAYRTALGGNGNFILMHSVGSLPHKTEIDVPLNYADYYFLEALKRKAEIENTAR